MCERVPISIYESAYAWLFVCLCVYPWGKWFVFQEKWSELESPGHDFKREHSENNKIIRTQIRFGPWVCAPRLSAKTWGRSSTGHQYSRRAVFYVTCLSLWRLEPTPWRPDQFQITNLRWSFSPGYRHKVAWFVSLKPSKLGIANRNRVLYIYLDSMPSRQF